MRDETVARSYGEALFALGEKHAQHDEFAAGMQMLDALLQLDPRVRLFLQTPKIEASVKKDALREALSGRVQPLFLNFLLLVIDKRRQRLLASIAREYRALLDEKLGRLNVDVTLARRPDDAELREIAARLSRVLDREVVPHVHVDDGILGGIIVRYRDRVIDGSLRRRLLALRGKLLQTAVRTSA
ncbi:MAG: ATP synthase F1 subunit delta [Longimicrobiales bacterium]